MLKKNKIMINIDVSLTGGKYITNEKIDIIYQEVFNYFIEQNKDYLNNFHENVFLSVSFINSKKMQEINAKYRNKDTTTDVISLGYLTEPIRKNTKLDTKLEFLGEVFVDYEYTKKDHPESEYKEYSLDQYLILILIHGLLHLLGYNHMTDEQEQEMFPLQKEILLRVIKKHLF